MLVLSRLRDEEVVLSKDGVEIGRVSVADLRGDSVRLGFTFPPEIRVDRLEVFDARALAARLATVQAVQS